MRTEVIKANNTEHTITISKENSKVSIEFNLKLKHGINPSFTIPAWAVPMEEDILFEPKIELKGEIAALDLTYGMIAQLKNFTELTFICEESEEYIGNLFYEGEAPKDSGIILNGVRLNCIASITPDNFFTMMSSKRNHEGNIITSTTLDTKRKKRFNITTIPLADEEYMLSPDVYSNTIETLESLLYSGIGNYKTFTYKNKDYTVVLTEEVQEINGQGFINSKLVDTVTYTFTLEEV